MRLALNRSRGGTGQCWFERLTNRFGDAATHFATTRGEDLGKSLGHVHISISDLVYSELESELSLKIHQTELGGGHIDQEERAEMEL